MVLLSILHHQAGVNTDNDLREQNHGSQLQEIHRPTTFHHRHIQYRQEPRQ